MKNNKYNRYTANDFLEEETFRRWVLSGEKAGFWNEYLASSPPNEGEIKEAIRILKKVGRYYEVNELDSDQVDLEWKKFANAKNMQPPVKRKRKRTKRSIFIWSMASAAAMALVVAVSWLILTNQSSEVKYQVYHTGSGEIRTIVLPDSTVVTLNGYSKLKVPDKFDRNGARSVILDGEGFFKVTPAHRTENNFTVHSALSDIVVLGTAFNVVAADHITEVTLEEGKVQMKYADDKGQVNNVTMAPGEQMSLKSTGELKKFFVDNIELFSEWKTGYFAYEDQKVSKILSDLERQYGVEFHAVNDTLKERKVNGVIAATDLNEALEVLKITLDVNISLEKEKIYRIH